MKVKSQGVIYAQDGTHLGRKEGKAIEAQVTRDVSTLEIKPVTVAHSATSDDVITCFHKLDGFLASC